MATRARGAAARAKRTSLESNDRALPLINASLAASARFAYVRAVLSSFIQPVVPVSVSSLTVTALAFLPQKSPARMVGARGFCQLFDRARPKGALLVARLDRARLAAH